MYIFRLTFPSEAAAPPSFNPPPLCPWKYVADIWSNLAHKSKNPLKKLLVSQLVNNPPAFYGNLKFNIGLSRYAKFPYSNSVE
jgi:hypothetical protein